MTKPSKCIIPCPRPGFGEGSKCLAERYMLPHTSDDWCSCVCHDPEPLEYHEGEWLVQRDPEGPEPIAVIVYSRNPSPETGHVGWCWWVLGKMGDAPTLEDAKRAAEAEIDERLVALL